MSSKIFVISGPSGAGEDSILNGIKDEIDYVKPVTTTTREMRPGEVEGINYYFVSKKKFKEMIDKDGFLEYTLEDRGNYYGLARVEIEKKQKEGKLIFLKFDYNGAIYTKKIIPEAVTIMIYAPLDILEQRLFKRGESREMIKNRLEYAQGWFDNQDKFDYVVENKEGELGNTIIEIKKIIKENL
ncbi:MAG: hypothetical protein ACD_7C00527G0003 [uncultured bacterium]|nr:MAG: hypothetical protein ACD_7C00527G0003 [uncultured bacterium]HBR78889.1 guanylate kinase [Candidatus Moranbacteria bacterium]